MTVIASGVLIYRQTSDGPRLLLLRNRDDGHWGMPKGRRDPEDEHEVATALREVAEETGWTGLALHPSFREVVEYVVGGAGEDQGKSKRVTYFLAEAPAGEPTLSPEHSECTWAGREQLRDLLQYEQLIALARHALTSVDAAAPS